MKYPVNREMAIQEMKSRYEAEGLDFTREDVDLVSMIVNRVNDAYAQGVADGKNAVVLKGGAAV